MVVGSSWGRGGLGAAPTQQLLSPLAAHEEGTALPPLTVSVTGEQRTEGHRKMTASYKWTEG